MNHEKAIRWVGSAYEDVRAFPNEPHRKAGFQLSKIQAGMEPDDWKPFDDVGAGIKEIRIREAGGIYRVMYVAKFEEAVYVLHCFQKKNSSHQQARQGNCSDAFPMLVKDASLGGAYPVMCVTLMNPRTGGVFASFGAHPSFEVALERSLTELLQGRSFEGLNDLPRPTFESNAVTEPNNFVEHFIDSSGVVSWRFFSAKANYEFVEWDFSGQGENSNAEEAATLFGILEDMGKETYMAVYDQLGATACRILVPGYSEVYPVEDLIWDNTNKALLFRDDILNLHRLDDDRLEALLERLNNSELDEYSDIATLIGIEFDENTEWGQLTVLELKLLIHLALQQFEEALELVGAFLQYNDNTVERGLFYQALNAVLEVLLDEDMELDDYAVNFRRMFGDARMDAVMGSVEGNVRFFGLTPTSMKLEGLDRHHRLIDSYRKLHKARGKAGVAAS